MADYGKVADIRTGFFAALKKTDFDTMTADWEAFGDDPFGTSADVFGKNVEDVDVWGANDSFGADADWDFDGDESDHEDGEPRSGKVRDSGSVKKRVRKPRSDKERSERSSSSRKGSTESRKSKSGSRHGSSRKLASSPKRQDSVGKSLGNFLDANDGFDPFQIAVEGSSASSPTSEEAHQRKKSTIRNVFDSPTGERPVFRPVSPSKSSAPSSPIPNGSMSSSRSRRRADSQSRQSTPSQARRPKAHTDDALASTYRTNPASRRSSAPSDRPPPAPLVKRRDGSDSRVRPGEVRARQERSGSRRGAVKDSLFKFLDDDQNDELPPPRSTSGREPSLSGFLNETRSKSSRGVDDRSVGVNSCPANVQSAPPTPSGGKSRRWANKMAAPPRDTAKKSKEVVDAAAIGLGNIAQKGYIEVQDGKMRLVFDVEA